MVDFVPHGCVALGEAIQIVGKHLCGDEWVGDELWKRDPLLREQNQIRSELNDLDRIVALKKRLSVPAGRPREVQTITLQEFEENDISDDEIAARRESAIEQYGACSKVLTRGDQVVVWFRQHFVTVDGSEAAFGSIILDEDTGTQCTVPMENWNKSDAIKIFQSGQVKFQHLIGSASKMVQGEVLIRVAELEAAMESINASHEVGPIGRRPKGRSTDKRVYEFFDRLKPNLKFVHGEQAKLARTIKKDGQFDVTADYIARLIRRDYDEAKAEAKAAMKEKAENRKD